ncbi:MAG TPA: hypothetical protein PLK99_07405 [Burkholderiales bacterium]|nr:hypothetical protein [Burkholderiales bacterium]
MNLIDLILLACTIAAPSSCHEYHMLLQSSGSLQSCMVQAPPYLARWVGEHPAYVIKRWRCAWPEQEDGKI